MRGAVCGRATSLPCAARRTEQVRRRVPRTCRACSPARETIVFCTSLPGCTARPWPGTTASAWRLCCRLAVGRERRACAAAHAAPGLWNFGHCLRGPGGKGGSGLPCRGAGGRCEKRYLALLRGTLAGPSTVRLALDTADRRQSRVLADTDDRLRWTEFLPLHVWGGAAATGPLAGLVRDTAHGESTSSGVRRGRRGRSRRPDPGRLPHPLRRAASDPGTRGGPGPSPLGGRPVWPVGSIRPGRNGILSAPRGPAAARRGLRAIAALAAARSPGRGGQEMA